MLLIMIFGYIVGILLGLYFRKGIALFFILFLDFIYLFLRFFKIKRLKKIRRVVRFFFPLACFILVNIFAFIGFFRICFLENKYNSLYKDIGNISVLGTVDSNINKNEYYSYFTVKVSEVNGDSKYKNTRLKVKYSGNMNLDYGDYIKINGEFFELSGFKNNGNFQYDYYYRCLNIYGNIKSKKIEKIGFKHSLGYFSNNLNNLITKKIDNFFDIDSGSLLRGILLGDTSQISDDVIENFQMSSIYHVLAVSGAHISCLILGVNFVLDYFVKSIQLKRKIIILVLGVFVFIVGFSPSVIRAYIMTIFILVSKMIHRKSNIFLAMFYSSFFILLVNPYFVYNPGFWLSFFSTFGISFMVGKYKLEIKNRFLNYFVNVFLVSLFSNIFILPITINIFHRVSLTFFVANLFVSSLILIVEVVGIMFVIFPNFISEYFSIVLNIILKLLLFISDICAKIPFSSILVCKFNFIKIVFYYFVVFFIVFKFRKKLKKFLIIFLIIILVFDLFSYFRSDFEISFIDVGQGDCIFIEGTNREKILIDGGGIDNYDIGKNVLAPYLLSRGVKKLDYIIISHFDSDHVRGLFYILKNLKVSNVVIGVQYESSENFESFMKIVNDKKINLIVTEAGNRVYLGKEMFIDVLWPDRENFIKDNVLNNNSLVFKLTAKSRSFLFTGDIEEKAEEAILELYENNLEVLNCDVLKVAHHGSKTSSTIEFLNAISPEYSFIEVGRNNKFGHPNFETLNKLKLINCKVYRTDLNGEIRLRVKNNGFVIKCFV